MTKWKLKSCPRCGGDMLIDKDMDFWYEQCLQCSYKVELQPLVRYEVPKVIKGRSRAGSAKNN